MSQDVTRGAPPSVSAPESTPRAPGAQDGNAPPPSDWLDQFEQRTKQQRGDAERTESALSWTRLITVVVGAALAIVLRGSPAALLAVIAVTIAAFFMAVLWHRGALRTRQLLERLATVIEETRSRLGGQVTLVRSGTRPEDEPAIDAVQHSALNGGLPTAEQPCRVALTRQELDDLDFYRPPVGLFGLLNRTYTRLGAVRLRDALEWPFVEPAAILRRQETIRWLEQNPETRLRLLAALAGLQIESRLLGKMVVALRDASPVGFGLRTHLVRLWSIVSGVLVVFFLSKSSEPDWLILLALLLLANGVLYFAALRVFIRPALVRWHDTSTALQAFSVAVERAADELPAKTELALLRERFLAVRGVLPRIGRITGWAESGGPIHALLNLALFYDVHVASAMHRVVLPQRDALLAALGAVHDLQMLCSLACFAWEQPHRCYPQPAALSQRLLAITEGAHPLLPAAQAVCNSLTLDGQRRVLVITGSNMSGKSTFLRMIASNVVLAQAGTIATAAQMRWSPLRLITDLQSRDDLAGAESYFLAEVRQLRRMFSNPADGVGVLGIMDEPLRGTNSHEQIAATLAVVEHLAGTGQLFMIATHDQQVTDLADGQTVLNAHFREDLGRDGLVFDYCLRHGPAQTRNALRVLEREGYPPELLASARRWVARLDAQAPNEAFASSAAAGRRA